MELECWYRVSGGNMACLECTMCPSLLIHMSWVSRWGGVVRVSSPVAVHSSSSNSMSILYSCIVCIYGVDICILVRLLVAFTGIIVSKFVYPTPLTFVGIVEYLPHKSVTLLLFRYVLLVPT